MDLDVRSSHPGREPFDEEAILDRLAERALVETQRSARPPGASEDDHLGAEMFLDIAAGFLERRADRAELIERLRARVLPSVAEDKSGTPPAEEATAPPADLTATAPAAPGAVEPD